MLFAISGWSWAWIAWGLMFAVIEAPAVWRKAKGSDTLTDHVRWFQRRWPGRVLFVCFWIWLTVHFLTTWW